jgi:hypothetical protein
LERRKMAKASRSRTATTIQIVLRVRRCMRGRQRLRYHHPRWGMRSREAGLAKRHSFTGSQGLCFCEFLTCKLFNSWGLACLTVSQPEKGGGLFCDSLSTKKLIFIYLRFEKADKPHLGGSGNLQKLTLEGSETSRIKPWKVRKPVKISPWNSPEHVIVRKFDAKVLAAERVMVDFCG